MAPKALALMKGDKRIFLQKKQAPLITTPDYSAKEPHDFTSTHLETTAIQKRVAHAMVLIICLALPVCLVHIWLMR
ncbi:MAG: hypothetical protein ACJA0C_000004 [Candidatus Endobugula sp.]|jgi:hypothetical protein